MKAIYSLKNKTQNDCLHVPSWTILSAMVCKALNAKFQAQHLTEKQQNTVKSFDCLTEEDFGLYLILILILIQVSSSSLLSLPCHPHKGVDHAKFRYGMEFFPRNVHEGATLRRFYRFKLCNMEQFIPFDKKK